MAIQDIVNKLRKQLEPLTKIKRDELISRPKWGEVNFEDIRPHIDRSFGIVDQLGLLPVELLTDNIANSITQTAKQLADAFERLDKFSIQTSSSVTSDRQTLVNQITTASDAFFTNTVQWLPFLAYQRGDVEKNIQKLTASVKDAEAMTSQGKDHLVARGKEMDEIITKAREASAAAGAAVFTQDFHRAADALETNATHWIKVTTWAAIVTLAIAVALS